MLRPNSEHTPTPLHAHQTNGILSLAVDSKQQTIHWLTVLWAFNIRLATTPYIIYNVCVWRSFFVAAIAINSVVVVGWWRIARLSPNCVSINRANWGWSTRLIHSNFCFSSFGMNKKRWENEDIPGQRILEILLIAKRIFSFRRKKKEKRISCHFFVFECPFWRQRKKFWEHTARGRRWQVWWRMLDLCDQRFQINMGSVRAVCTRRLHSMKELLVYLFYSRLASRRHS